MNEGWEPSRAPRPPVGPRTSRRSPPSRKLRPPPRTSGVLSNSDIVSRRSPRTAGTLMALRRPPPIGTGAPAHGVSVRTGRSSRFSVSRRIRGRMMTGGGSGGVRRPTLTKTRMPSFRTASASSVLMMFSAAVVRGLLRRPARLGLLLLRGRAGPSLRIFYSPPVVFGMSSDRSLSRCSPRCLTGRDDRVQRQGARCQNAERSQTWRSGAAGPFVSVPRARREGWYPRSTGGCRSGRLPYSSAGVGCTAYSEQADAMWKASARLRGLRPSGGVSSAASGARSRIELAASMVSGSGTTCSRHAGPYWSLKYSGDSVSYVRTSSAAITGLVRGSRHPAIMPSPHS